MGPAATTQSVICVTLEHSDVLQVLNYTAIPVDTTSRECVVDSNMRRRIILADDEAYVTTILASKLRQRGHDVVTAPNGQQAFELATQSPPDLIITDYQMPILSGYEMSVKLRQDPRTAKVPVLMLTARGHHLSPEQLAATNIKHLAAKPFSARELLEKADEILAASPAAQEVRS
jgi:CheY-like chemotaxis protein